MPEILDRLTTALILKLALIGYLGYAVLLWVFQRPLMYHGTRLEAPPADARPTDAEGIELEASGGPNEAWWFRPEGDEPAPAVIVAHGNAELISDNVSFARALRDLGVGVLLVEYPGFGSAKGEPSRASIGEAFTLAYDRLTARPEVDSERIVGLGRSLGAGAITDLAVARPVRALVLQSAFSSIGSMVLRGYWMPPFLVKDDFDNVANLRAWDGPVLVFHGTQDRVVSIGHGERLAAVRDGVRLVRLECGHNDCAWSGAAVMEELRDFLIRTEILPRAD
ncbi:MAG: alpha/beta hydrolase [Gemmatimonadetes bacterium]|nr:alpha/beta hydrolase [Gemmatimonadota bacterium]